MKDIRFLLMIMMLLSLAACEGSWSNPRYQLVTASDGKVYRIDAQTGAVHYVTAEKMLPLNDGLPVLHVGEYYQMADANGNVKYLKYVGNAQFEKSLPSAPLKE